MAEQVEVRAARVHFGGVRAVDGVDLLLPRGTILGLIGPNGAGKTTLVNAITGFQRLDSGTVTIDGHDVTNRRPERLARLGVSRTFQSVRLFPRLSVLDNVALGAAGLGVSQRRARELAQQLLARARATAWADLPAAALPHGEERRVGIMRALAMQPRFLFLDEPAAGLDEQESDALLGWLQEIPSQLGCGMLVIEHDMRLVLRLCPVIQVLDYGKTIANGRAEDVRRNPAVISAYLGTEAGA